MDILKLGSRGPDVELVQLALKRSGFYMGNTDGIYGPQTQNAVIRFQRSYGLSPDGIVGPITFKNLEPYILGYANVKINVGDTFYSLAQRYFTTVTSIENANPTLDPDNLTVGNTIVIPFSYNVVPTDVHMTSKLLDYCIRGLRARYPFIEVGSVGNSVIGTPIQYLKLGSGQNQVFYNGSHHANEWITTTLLMKFLEDYAVTYTTNGVIGQNMARSLYRTTTLYCVPMVNPDGVDLVCGAITQNSPYYQNALKINNPPVDFPNGWKANIVGTDLNLNYPAMWERAKEIKYAAGYTSPGPRDYVGEYPLSAVESRAIYDFTLSKNFSLTLSYHTQGEVIFWKFADYNPPRALEIGEIFSSLSGYALETTPEFSAYAGYKDWFIQQYNRPSYTIEAGRGISPLPLSQFYDIFAKNIGILTAGLTVTA